MVTQPLALIEGDLALPDARLLRGLPPPFGLLPRPVRSVAQRDVSRTIQRDTRCDTQQAAAIAVQPAVRNAVVRHRKPVRQRPLPPGTLFRFFYKVQRPRDFTAHINAQLAEARYYLDAGKKARTRSSRKDYVLGASIFAATGIALAWLLTVTAMRDIEKGGAVAIAQPVEVHAQEQVSLAQPAISMTSTVARSAATAIEPTRGAVRSGESVPEWRTRGSVRPVPLQQAVRPVKSKPMGRAASAEPHLPSSSSRSAESYKRARALSPDTVIRHSASRNTSNSADRPGSSLSDEQINARVALNRLVAPSAQATVSAQPEWNTRVPSPDAAPEQAALRNWAAQQRQPSVSTDSTTTTPRASVSATTTDTTGATWNARMAQRRITDNPNAFGANVPRP